ncbi:Ig-like domain-containing protein [Anaerocolumna sp. MB42-C2]|uniref:Ig-like domain-containing protein n=1 Tax=Anaerocolumna sp. MB42-C2 TaxID=3070997 RepID=UPI0027DFE468|nr:Ig-like domain-containing protein [Anaerocolumna sp. MB42-C2]WMJ85805.1 Ig-like domain-containing protein [Anaerocolumna sp. MB42-C2]
MTRSTNTDKFRVTAGKLLAVVMTVALIITCYSPISAQAAAKPAISKTVSVLKGKKVELKVKNPTKGAAYKWKTGNKSIATVDSKGVITGVKKGSTTVYCTVTAKKTSVYLNCKVTVVEPAKKIVINNKVTKVNAGQVYDLNRTLTPAASNDPTIWKSSNEKVLKFGKWGKFTALKEGTVTVTATTLSGKSDKVTIKVVDKDGIVTTLKGLEDLLGSGAGLITLKTEDAAAFTIPQGNYSKQKLVVDAPNADVTNNGVFKEVEIKAIKASTWFEMAAGNIINVTAVSPVRIMIDKLASASVIANSANTGLTLVNNGTITGLTVNANSVISISGTSTAVIPVANNFAGANITTSIPLAVTATAKFTLTALPGAEATTVAAATADAVPEVQGNITIPVTVGNSKPEETGNQGSSGGSGGGSNGGGSNGGSSTTTKTITKTGEGAYTLPVEYTKLKKVVVSYNGVSYQVSSEILTQLKGFLSNEAATIEKWKNTTETTKTISGQKVIVTGEKGELTKTVTFSDGLLNGKSYDVTVDEKSVTVTGGSGKSYTISKSDDNKTLYIGDAPDNLTFKVTY